jgi:hypothetical protein
MLNKICKASTCHIGKRKAKVKEREVAIIFVLADGGQVHTNDRKKELSSHFLFQAIFSFKIDVSELL